MKNTTTVPKITPLEFPILDSIKERWSPRCFAEETPITEKSVNILLEAGRWAPSSSNMQPWRVIWGLKGTEMYDRIFNCLDDFNQSWALNSRMLWINAYKKTMNNSAKENFHALHDLGLFMGNVLQQASSMRIAVHQMAGVDFKRAHSEFKFTEEYHVATAVAFGYFGGDLNSVPDALKEQELTKLRERKKQEAFSFNGDFKE